MPQSAAERQRKSRANKAARIEAEKLDKAKKDEAKRAAQREYTRKHRAQFADEMEENHNNLSLVPRQGVAMLPSNGVAVGRDRESLDSNETVDSAELQKREEELEEAHAEKMAYLERCAGPVTQGAMNSLGSQFDQSKGRELAGKRKARRLKRKTDERKRLLAAGANFAPGVQHLVMIDGKAHGLKQIVNGDGSVQTVVTNEVFDIQQTTDGSLKIGEDSYWQPAQEEIMVHEETDGDEGKKPPPSKPGRLLTYAKGVVKGAALGAALTVAAGPVAMATAMTISGTIGGLRAQASMPPTDRPKKKDTKKAKAVANKKSSVKTPAAKTNSRTKVAFKMAETPSPPPSTPTATGRSSRQVQTEVKKKKKKKPADDDRRHSIGEDLRIEIAIKEKGGFYFVLYNNGPKEGKPYIHLAYNVADKEAWKLDSNGEFSEAAEPGYIKNLEKTFPDLIKAFKAKLSNRQTRRSKVPDSWFLGPNDELL